jgi:hypothetical protein
MIRQSTDSCIPSSSFAPAGCFEGTADVVIPGRPVDVRGSLSSPELVSVHAGEMRW